jgi:hypothetical protein
MGVVFLSFRWTEGEPAHFASCLVEMKCQCPSRVEWAEVAVLLVELDDGSQRRRNLGSNLMAVLVGRDVNNKDYENVFRNGALEVDEQQDGERYLNSD